MAAQILDGRKISQNIRSDIKSEVEKMKRDHGITPGLAVIIVGDDEASHVYVSMKEKACENVGFYSEVHKLSNETTEDELIKVIEQLNDGSRVHGILVQLPLPQHIDENIIISHIAPEKDVDGLHPINNGKLFLGEDSFIPCTPKGIIRLIKETDTYIEGKHAVVVGRSNIVGKPISLLLLQENATVTICHSKTQNLKEIIQRADIVVAAAGVPNLIKGDMIKENAVIIDAGTRKVNDQLVGDVEYDIAREHASWITPVPGGVGPMTITMLLENTLKAAKKNAIKSS